MHTSRLMLAVATTLAPVGCAPVKTSFERPAIEAWPERAVVPVPAGWKVVTSSQTPDVGIEEMVAPDETAEAWTQMFTILVTRGKVEPNLESHARAFVGISQRTCAAPVVGTTPSVAADHSYPALVQFLSCSKLSNHDYGEAVLSKFVSVQDGYYSIQWSWRFAPASNAATPVSVAQLDAAKQVVAGTFVCDDANPQSPCPAPRTK